MSNGKRPENDDFEKPGLRSRPFSRGNRAHQQQQQILAHQNQFDYSLMEYSSNNLNTQTHQSPAQPTGFTTNATTNYPSESYSTFMAEDSSFNCQNLQSGQSLPSMSGLPPSNAQSGIQQPLPTNFVQPPNAFGGNPIFNMNSQVNPNSLMLWNFFNAMMNTAGSQMAINQNLSTGSIGTGEIKNATTSQMAINQNLSTGSIGTDVFQNAATSQKAISQNLSTGSIGTGEILNVTSSEIATNQIGSIESIVDNVIPFESSPKRKTFESPTGSSRTMGLSITNKKRKIVKGFEYEEVDPTLTVKDIQKAYGKTIKTVLPNEGDQNYEMYNVVRRLQRNKCIIPFFFRCEVCEKIIYVHTVKNHAALTRHFAKCNGPVQIDRSAFNQLLEGVLDIGAETGSFGLMNTVFPSKISDENIENVLAKMRQGASQQKD